MSVRTGWTGDTAGPSDLFAGSPVRQIDSRTAFLTPAEHEREVFALEAERERSELRQAERARRARADELASRRDEIESRVSVGLLEARTAAETIALMSALADRDDAVEAAETRRRAKDMADHAWRQEDALAISTGDAIRSRQLAADAYRRAAGRSPGRDVIRSAGRHVER